MSTSQVHDHQQKPQRVGALLPMPSCFGSGGTPVGHGKDTHGTLGPEQRGGRGWPTPTPKGRSAHAMTRTQDSPTHKSSDKQNKTTEQFFIVATPSMDDHQF